MLICYLLFFSLQKLSYEDSNSSSNASCSMAAASAMAVAAAAAAVNEDQDDKDDKDSKKKKNRCAVCRKKVGLTGKKTLRGRDWGRGSESNRSQSYCSPG